MTGFNGITSSCFLAQISMLSPMAYFFVNGYRCWTSRGHRRSWHGIATSGTLMMGIEECMRSRLIVWLPVREVVGSELENAHATVVVNCTSWILQTQTWQSSYKEGLVMTSGVWPWSRGAPCWLVRFCLIGLGVPVGSERRGDTGRLERPSGQGKGKGKTAAFVDRRNHEKRWENQTLLPEEDFVHTHHSVLEL